MSKQIEVFEPLETISVSDSRLGMHFQNIEEDRQSLMTTETPLKSRKKKGERGKRTVQKSNIKSVCL